MTDFGRRMALHSSSHEDGGVDEIEATALDGRVNYVDRGDNITNDFALSDFTTDATWRDLDLSAIVPSGERLVYIRVFLLDDLVNSYAWFRSNGNVNTKNSALRRIQVANNPNDMMFFITCDSNGIIEYIFANTTYNTITLNVLGWFA